MQTHEPDSLFQTSFYDVLELTPDATPQEIRSAYLRLKSAYSKDNIAHYTLFSREETEATLQKVETAYLILSNPEKRRAYDQAQGHGSSFAPFPNNPFQDADPRSLSGTAQNLGQNTAQNFAAAGYGLSSGNEKSAFDEPSTTPAQRSATIAPLSTQNLFNAPVDVDAWIASETEWGGSFIRRIREAKRMSLEDLSDYTRISRAYLAAIEDENIKKLPALVYVRGFLQQIAKRLKLPVDTLIQKYLERIKTISTNPNNSQN
jgi:curved DNA-binding protein CbpA